MKDADNEDAAETLRAYEEQRDERNRRNKAAGDRFDPAQRSRPERDAGRPAPHRSGERRGS
ncbi:hypothetical protein CBM2599_A120537 [Cupriavidus taiwanensis]|nr:hypothetical protein CBM2599_A120537 [Cupriavidus taiwanensis]SOY81941.1 hypothetical protein CBM2600_A120559 [Cupriavidus taiwanensis]